MKRGNWADDPHLLLDASHDGVIRADALARLGVARTTVTRRCGPNGPWQRILPGIVLLHNARPTTQQRTIAAHVYGGPDCVVTGHTALALHGYEQSRGRDHVQLLIPHTQHRKDFSYVRVERTWCMPEVVQHGRFRLAPVVRCALDAARRTPDPRACRSLLAAVVQRGDATVADLAQELACAPRRGTAIPHSVVRELGDGAHSVAELDAQRLYAGTGLPPMMRNIDIADAHGRWIARPDGWIDEVALAWEIDSMKFHLSPSLHEGTQRRRARMERFGIVVVSHVPRQLRLEPDVVIAEVKPLVVV